MDDETKYYLCNGQAVRYADLYKHPRAHILGHFVERSDEGRKVTGLLLWHDAIPTDCVPPVSPRKKAVLVGDAREICCELCAREERWAMGKAAFLALMGRIFEERLRDGKEKTT